MRLSAGYADVMETTPWQPPTSTARQRRVRIAWIVALAADAVQWVALPLFLPGAASPFNLALEAVVSLVLFRLLGWHPALLPALLAELIPGLDLVPAWTIAVFLATRGRPAPPNGPVT